MLPVHLNCIFSLPYIARAPGRMVQSLCHTLRRVPGTTRQPRLRRVPKVCAIHVAVEGREFTSTFHLPSTFLCDCERTVWRLGRRKPNTFSCCPSCGSSVEATRGAWPFFLPVSMLCFARCGEGSVHRGHWLPSLARCVSQHQEGQGQVWRSESTTPPTPKAPRHATPHRKKGASD
ncbi:hypothetical protein TRVL_06697 [Trypanosoma vivax]|nr:hypothetical protein TRVL_06697 [Trypanosoma vivax]